MAKKSRTTQHPDPVRPDDPMIPNPGDPYPGHPDPAYPSADHPAQQQAGQQKTKRQKSDQSGGQQQRQDSPQRGQSAGMSMPLGDPSPGDENPRPLPPKGSRQQRS